MTNFGRPAKIGAANLPNPIIMGQIGKLAALVLAGPPKICKDTVRAPIEAGLLFFIMTFWGGFY